MEQEDSSTYKNQPELVSQPPETTAPEPTPVTPQPVKKRSKAPLVLTVLLLLALVAAGALGWLWYQQMTRANDLESQLKSTRAQVNALKTFTELNSSAQVTQDTKNENDTIISTALAYAAAPKAASSTKYTATIRYNKDNFARVSIGADQGSGFSELLKKVNDEWVVVVVGQSEPSQEDITKYAIPQAAVDSYKQ